MWNRILTGISLAGAALAAIFYALFNKEKHRALKAKKAQEFSEKKTQSKAEAKKEHEELKKKGPKAISDDTDRMLLDD